MAAARPARRLAEQPGREAVEPERLGRELMADLALGGPGDAAAAALDELARNFTYGAQGAGNGSLSGAWYRRNQVRAGPGGARAALLPSVRKTPGGPSGRADGTFAHAAELPLSWESGAPPASPPRRAGLRADLCGVTPGPLRTILPFQPESSLFSWKDSRSVGDSPPPMFPSGSFCS